MRTRVKICGITRQEDALAAVASGTDAIGLVFYPGSPRYVNNEQARVIAAGTGPFVSVTGLFVNAAEEAICNTLANVPLGLLQFHGAESNADCNRYGLPFIKALPVREDADLLASMADYPDAIGFLLDAWQPDRHGGGGETFDWDRIPAQLPAPIILAGGLTPENVAAAISKVKPYAVDVSSGVETEKGIKSADKIAKFMKGVRDSGTITTN